eukprot:CAMPEP_0115165378 /NCGR_PEP_ID=MMETSP0227-20121206/73564_1 /TAXON_ID=89957 /ORGANISM="Polarella glacialis, Strain CCMP 1383" /LENGTH=1520 /DNA_ID=CAMNT_0002577853 /DNA_START=81 /DNA_END=4643 /DNA_ORIENTATION=-
MAQLGSLGRASFGSPISSLFRGGSTGGDLSSPAPAAPQLESSPAAGPVLATTVDLRLLDAEEAPGNQLQAAPFVDDDMSDDDEDMGAAQVPMEPPAAAVVASPEGKTAPPETPPAATPPAVVAAVRPPSVAAQVADCKAKILELQRSKDQRLQQEDYMGAHEAKQLILEQEQKLQALRQSLDGMPTPSRASGAGLASPQGPRVSLAVGFSHRQSVAGSTASLEAAAAVAAAGLAKAEESGSLAAASTASPEDAQEEQDIEVEGSEASEETSCWRPVSGRSDLMELQSEEVTKFPFRLPCDTFDRLYPYQRAGVAWMARLMQKGAGGVLADEMGLGKTIQVCALLNGARKAGATHALLLMPVSLLAQWAQEAKIWCPGWPVYTYYGTAWQRAKALRGIRKPQGGILVTSYSLVSNTEDLFEVAVEEAPEPKRRRGRLPGGQKAAKRLKTGDDDDVEQAEEDEEEPQEPEMPPGELPAVGKSRPWDVVVCDEAHRMKNISTLLGKSLRKLKSSSRILLTGTPVQNALQDLWALMDFAHPGLLGNHATFVKTFSEPIDRGSVRGAKVWAIELKKHLSVQLRALISPHMLRRTKLGAGLMVDTGADGSAAEDVAMEDTEDGEEVVGQIKKLPPKKETIVWLYPSTEQLAAYQKVLEKSEVIREACSKGKLGIEVFRAIGLLKRLCNHPLLLLPTPKPGAWAELLKDVQSAEASSPEAEAEVAAQILAHAEAETEGEAEAEAEAQSRDALQDDDQEMLPSEAVADESDIPGAAAGAAEEDARSGRAVEMLLRKLPRGQQAVLEQSAKLRCLASLLPALAEKGHRTLVFSQSVKMLDLIQICCLKPKGLRCLRIDGMTDAQSRHEKVNKFNEQRDRFQCMLLTTSVGGVGLNLTSADRVILVDPAWNPATDAQAVDRAFRIGQTKEVRVYRLIMNGLIEDKMFRLQVFKMGLTRTALESGQQQTYFSAREIRALFEWTDPAEGETRKMLLEKHGEEAEERVKEAALEDGSGRMEGDSGEADPGWFEAGPAVALSDFACLFSNTVQEEEVQDENFSAQVAEAQDKLGAADEKLLAKQQARAETEASRDRAAKELEEAGASFEQLKDKKLRADEALKDKRGELTQARKLEQTAQLRLDKAAKARSSAQERHANAQVVLESYTEAGETATRQSSEAVQGARTAEEAFAKVLADAESQLGVVDDRGCSKGGGAVDAAGDRVRKAAKALDKLKAAMENSLTRQVEFESTEEELAKADQGHAEAEAAVTELEGEEEVSAQLRSAEVAQRSRERERKRLEELQAKAAQRSEASRESVLQALQAFIEAGLWFSDSFQKTQSRPVKMEQVKSAQAAVKAAIKPLTSHWQAVRKAREAQGKASNQRRKVTQKLSAAIASKVDAELQATASEKEHLEATEEEAQLRAERGARESELGATEGAKAAVELEDADMKRRRDELKAAQPRAKEDLKIARLAEKEALNERQALHTQCSRREKEQMQLEEAKNTAVSTLKAEEYKTGQVSEAYDQRWTKKASE